MRLSALALAPSLALAACTLGPSYHAPPVMAVRPSFVRSPAAITPASPTAREWWTALGDPILDDLIRRGLSANPDLNVARARLRQARASFRLEKANARPNGNASAIYLHGELPPTNLGAIGSTSDGGAPGSEEPGRTQLDFYNLGFDASWEVDLFGGKRRAAESSGAAAEAAAARIADLQVTLSAEIAKAYVGLRDRQRRLQLVAQEAELNRRLLDLSQRRVAAGTATTTDLLPLRRQIEDADALPIPLNAERDAYLNALAVLVGVSPGALDALLVAPGTLPVPPVAVAVGDPAALLARRPDIRAAERTLASQTAKIGVAEAARFPKLSFMGIIGMGGSNPGDVFDTGNVTALALPRIAWNVLDFGRNAARVEQAKGLRDEAEAQYRSTVLTALRDAEDSLTRFGSRRLALAGVSRQKALADQSVAAIKRRFSGGTVRITDVMDAERQGLAAERRLVEAMAAVTTDFISLQKSLGLGWAPLNEPSSSKRTGS